MVQSQRFPVPVFSVLTPLPRLSSLETPFRFWVWNCVRTPYTIRVPVRRLNISRTHFWFQFRDKTKAESLVVSIPIEDVFTYKRAVWHFLINKGQSRNYKCYISIPVSIPRLAMSDFFIPVPIPRLEMSEFRFRDRFQDFHKLNTSYLKVVRTP